MGEQKENQWTKSICKKLRKELKTKGKEYDCEVGIELPYFVVLSDYDDNWKEPTFERSINHDTFETDLLVYEIKNNKKIPRVIIESKIANMTTHDSLAYCEKAEDHKSLTPFLRYGVMIAESKNGLTQKYFKHGMKFDFVFCFKNKKPRKGSPEWSKFVEIIKQEIDTSKKLEDIYLNSKINKNERKMYFHNNLEIE